MARSIKEISNFASLIKRKHPHLQFFLLTDPKRQNNLKDANDSLIPDVKIIHRHFGRIKALNSISNSRQRIIPSFDPLLKRDRTYKGFHLPMRMAKSFSRYQCFGKIITASAHNYREIRLAINFGAEFILISKIFKSQSEGRGKTIGPTRLRIIARQFKTTKFVALGGIGPRNYKRVINTGIKGIAGVGFD